MDFKQRLETEKSVLEANLTKLNEFNQSEKVDKIGADHKSLLIIQAGAMYTYLECLKARLDRL